MLRMFVILDDGAWHSLKEIAEGLKISVDELAAYCGALSKHGVVDYNPASGIVRLGFEFRRLLTKLKIEEEEEWEKAGVATVIVPSGKGFEIQGIRIDNMTENDTQFELRFRKRLQEIVVLKA